MCWLPAFFKTQSEHSLSHWKVFSVWFKRGKIFVIGNCFESKGVQNTQIRDFFITPSRTDPYTVSAITSGQIATDTCKWTKWKDFFFLMSALVQIINFFLMWSFKSKQLNVARFSVGPDVNLVWSYSSPGACGSACALTQGTSEPPRTGVSRTLPIEARQQRWSYKQCSQNNQLKSNLKAVTLTLLNTLIQILSSPYSLYLWNFSSTTYWLKNKRNQQSCPFPTLFKEKTVT